MKPLSTVITTLMAVAVIVATGTGLYIYAGEYNIGADDHHTAPVTTIITTLRNRSIENHAKALVVPNLSDPQLILKGAGQYAAMCTDCHLKPGQSDSEIRAGLYPQPPNLSRIEVDPKAAFWVIKHGIKMSAMPAWGGSHDDATIWSMVAFVEQLPTLSPEAYKAIVAKAPPDDDMDMDEDTGDRAHAAEPNTNRAMQG